MFTGLVEDLGEIIAVTPLAGDGALRLTLAAPLLREALPTGASLCVDGVCLTLTSQDPEVGRATVDVGPETAALTTLGPQGGPLLHRQVNLERALRLSDRLGGHLVAGHVDAVGRIARTATRGPAWDVFISAPAAQLRYVIHKGSICVDGISLTVNQVDDAGFAISLIPHSQARTTLSRKRAGDAVNLEVDLIGKYVEKLLTPGGATRPGGLTLETLKEHGFAPKE